MAMDQNKATIFCARPLLTMCTKPSGINLSVNELFVSDGAKSDTGNIGDILGPNIKVAVTDPVYPVYVDTNVMAGRAGQLQANGYWSNIVYMPVTKENGFVPELPKEEVDVIYLCFPNNPTGTTLTRDQLKVFVDYARQHKTLLLFDAAYEAFITEKDVPHSIYEMRVPARWQLNSAVSPKCRIHGNPLWIYRDTRRGDGLQ